MMENTKEQWFEKYQKIVVVNGKSQQTTHTELKSHRVFWKYLESVGEQRDLMKLNKSTMLDFMRHLQDSQRKVNYQLTLLAHLRVFYKESLRQGWIMRSPFDKLELPKKTEDVPLVLSVSEMKQLLSSPDMNAVDGFRDRCMMELAYGSGLRRHEVTGAKLSQFSTDFRTMRVQGKGGKEAVTPVTRLSAHYLSFYTREIWPYINKQKQESLFLNVRTGKPLSPQFMNTMTKQYDHISGLNKGISSHVFRFSVATHLGESGVDIRYIQEFLRHENIDSTVRYVQQGFRHLQDVHRQTHPRGDKDGT